MTRSSLDMKKSYRQRLHQAGEICRRSFISTVVPTVTLIRHENGAFQKRSSNRRNLETSGFRFRVHGKHELFENNSIMI